LKKLLDTKKWICHNGKFDLAGLRQFGTPVLYFDTMLASYVLDERPGVHSLGYLGVELLGTPDWKSVISQYVGKGDSYALVPRDVLYRYNAYDVAVTWQLYEYYLAKLDEEGRKLHDFLVQCSNALMHGEMGGLNVDIEYLDHLTDTYLERLGELEEHLKPWVDNPRSPKQVKEALELLKVKVADTRKETLRNALLKAKKDSEQEKFLQLMLTQRREQKLYGTYVKGTRKRLYQDRVHPTLLLHGTTTGRLACRNPNLQNVPRESSIRRLFVPGPGNVFVQADYATIELRVLATEAEEPFLRDLFNEGRDIHDEFSLKLFGPGFTKDQRVRTKAFVYGSAYGREPFSIAQEYKIPVAEAEAMYDSFMGSIPKVQEFRAEIKRKILEDQDDLVTHFGRHRRFWLITDDNKKDVVKEGLAFIPQSTASDINLHSLIRLRSMGLDVRLPVHDSILVECSERDASDVGRVMAECMSDTAREVYSSYVPFPVDVEIGYSWGDLGKDKYWEDPDPTDEEELA
jgi:DNA polymerase-1